jgi:folate-dependent phosphoribosylglycinamide formyltransferase PurN
MKVALLIGDSPRHLYIARCVAATGFLVGLCVERREERNPPPPSHIDPQLAALFVRHFEERTKTENRFFSTSNIDTVEIPLVHVSQKELNGEKLWTFLAAVKPEIVISYGVHKLTADTLSRMPDYRWNIHGGLSPWYRGCITHFWPSYMLEPQMTGMTLHHLTNQLDGGPILHQNVGPLISGDGIHDLACRTVLTFGEELVRILEFADGGTLKPAIAQKSVGKLWLARDWRPEHLKLIYETYGNRIVDRYLNGMFSRFSPQLIRQF